MFSHIVLIRKTTRLGSQKSYGFWSIAPRVGPLGITARTKPGINSSSMPAKPPKLPTPVSNAESFRIGRTGSQSLAAILTVTVKTCQFGTSTMMVQPRWVTGAPTASVVGLQPSTRSHSTKVLLQSTRLLSSLTLIQPTTSTHEN